MAVDNDELLKRATRIRGRAVRRCGELLKQFDARGDHRKTDGGDGSSQTDVARQAGLSERQQLQAVRVANVPANEFERLVEGETPPSLTALAAIGKNTRPVIDHGGRDPADFNAAMHFKGMMEDYSRDLARWNLTDLLPRLIDRDRATIRRLITQIDAVHDAIIITLMSIERVTKQNPLS